ncbi:9705_t:CDS:2 [Diversispora eburnea]|uniref:9705_t:CDS:1 n=1 Tax=Diversispora eburnea TaxID=1213867 RepID=A0A9N9BKG0_9GLOM|nr:9705_t:CDS:2 [Diversispora eburnea]
MLEEIEFLVNIGCGAGLIIRGLQKLFPNAIIHPENIYNVICSSRHASMIAAIHEILPPTKHNYLHIKPCSKLVSFLFDGTETTCDPQEESAITVCSKKVDGKFLNKIRSTQVFSETVKLKLSRQVKYNQGYGYAKRAIGLALKIGCEDKLIQLLQNWIKEKEREK